MSRPRDRIPIGPHGTKRQSGGWARRRRKKPFRFKGVAFEIGCHPLRQTFLNPPRHLALSGLQLVANPLPNELEGRWFREVRRVPVYMTPGFSSGVRSILCSERLQSMRAAETRDSPFEHRVPPGGFDYIEELATANAPPAARHPCRFPMQIRIWRGGTAPCTPGMGQDIPLSPHRLDALRAQLWILADYLRAGIRPSGQVASQNCRALNTTLAHDCHAVIRPTACVPRDPRTALTIRAVSMEKANSTFTPQPACISAASRSAGISR